MTTPFASSLPHASPFPSSLLDLLPPHFSPPSSPSLFMFPFPSPVILLFISPFFSPALFFPYRLSPLSSRSSPSPPFSILLSPQLPPCLFCFLLFTSFFLPFSSSSIPSAVISLRWNIDSSCTLSRATHVERAEAGNILRILRC